MFCHLCTEHMMEKHKDEGSGWRALALDRLAASVKRLSPQRRARLLRRNPKRNGQEDTRISPTSADRVTT